MLGQETSDLPLSGPLFFLKNLTQQKSSVVRLDKSVQYSLVISKYWATPKIFNFISDGTLI